MTTEASLPGTAKHGDKIFAVGRSGGGESKIKSLREAIADHVKPGDHIHIGYADARPNAAIREVVRQYRGTSPGFTISTAGLVSVQNALISEGLVSKVISSFIGENYPAPKPSPVLRAALEDGRIEVEGWSLWTLVARLVAGAMGVPFFPVQSLLGSDMAKDLGGQAFDVVSADFGGESEQIGVVKAMRPDVVFVQAPAADEFGNVILAAPYGESYWGAMASKNGVVACVESIVPSSVIRENSALTSLPGHVVKAVCEVPFGSHPYGMYNPIAGGAPGYVQDGDFMAEVQQAMKDPLAFDAWVKDWILGPSDHDDYLCSIGVQKLAELRGRATSGFWAIEALNHTQRAPEPRPQERLVCSAARIIAERVTSEGRDVMLAGVGLSNLAAWIAARQLWGSDRDVQVMAEIGMVGYDPRPGDPFIFSNRNLATCTSLTDVMAVLGTLVAGPGSNTIGVVGAAQVDRSGAINSTRTPSGRYLVGSGGANDIASAADEVVVVMKHGDGRLVDRVPYITSPGHAVSAIVTNRCTLRRVDGEFVITSVFPDGGKTLDTVVAGVIESIGWDIGASSDVTFEPDPEPADIELIRRFDPDATFIS